MSETKVILVTGGSSGIGKAIASYLSSIGHKVYGSSRNFNNGQSFENFTGLKMDVRDEDSVAGAISYILEQEGRIDVLINNAGLGMIGPLENTSSEEIREVFETNIFGVLNVCKKVLPGMRNQGSGHIINITSIGGFIALPYRGIYCSSKFAVEAFTETLSMEVKRFGIHVTILEPGDFKTNINQNRKQATVNDDSPYKIEFEAMIERVNEEVNNSREPILIGKKISRIIKNQNPRIRYKVATPMQRLSVTLKRILPGRWFEKLIMNHYKV